MGYARCASGAAIGGTCANGIGEMFLETFRAETNPQYVCTPKGTAGGIRKYRVRRDQGICCQWHAYIDGVLQNPALGGFASNGSRSYMRIDAWNEYSTNSADSCAGWSMSTAFSEYKRFRWTTATWVTPTSTYINNGLGCWTFGGYSALAGGGSFAISR